MGKSPGRPQKPTQSLRVAAAQMQFGPTIDDNLAQIVDLAQESARRRADAVLFPECAVTGYAFDFESLRPVQIRAALEAIGVLARQLGVNILIGAPVFRRRTLHNCLVVFNREGRATYCYAKNHLTPSDQKIFKPGDAVALFTIDRVPATCVICHERRYPELVRLAVMSGAKVLFHPNAGLDALGVSRKKRGGRDGIAARAFENAIFYVFANSVGRQGGGKWSAGDSKIVAPDEKVLALAGNEEQEVITAKLNLEEATRTYAQRSMVRPRFLSGHWREMVAIVRRRAKEAALDFDLP